MERRQFTREFKLEAVRLIKDRGVSYAQASQDLGVHTSQLRDWVKKFADDPHQAFPGHGQLKPEQAEIARLKREVTKLKAERDILKRMARPVCKSNFSMACRSASTYPVSGTSPGQDGYPRGLVPHKSLGVEHRI
jgi:transposase